MKTATVFNHAGGAGKTSVTRDVGYELAQSGQRVLLIDLDPQANITTGLGVEVDEARDPARQLIAEVLAENPYAPPPATHAPSRGGPTSGVGAAGPGRAGAANTAASASRSL